MPAQEDARRRVPRIKVVVPAVPPGFVSRPRLLSALDQAPDAMVTLVCAPAGSGKTLLLADWVRRRGLPATAWVSLDSDDNDDRRFWSGVLGALAACPVVPHDSPIRRLPVPHHPSRDLGFLAAVVNALDGAPGPVWLVLDDVQELADPEPLHGLETLLRHQPAGLRLVLASRYNPPLPLARLRLADQLVEIRADALRFSPEEARALLEAAGADLRPGQLRQLVAQTEGWAAGLRLAAVSLSEAEDHEAFLAEFAENDRAVAEYLIDEVLSRLPDELREFLCTISVCDQVSAGLARAVSGRADIGRMLDTLESKTSLLVRAGGPGHWYRMHALVRSYLLADLTRATPARAAALHANAAGWLAEHGHPVQALAHAGRTGDSAQVAALLRRQAVPLITSGEHEVLRRALTDLGEGLLAEDPLFALVSAALQLECGQAEAAALHLAHAEAAWPERPAPELESLRRLVHSRQALVGGDVEEMLRTTDPLAAGNATALDASAMLHRGAALLAAGRLEAAEKQVSGALAVAREHGQHYVATQCLATLGVHAAAVGDFPLMSELAGRADEEATAHGWQRTLAGADACVLLAYGALLAADPGDCLRQARRAAALSEDAIPRPQTPLAIDTDALPANRGLHLLVGVLAGIARFETGAWPAGLRQIHDARVAVGGGRLSPMPAALCAVLEHRAALRFGWTEDAQETLAWSRTSIPGSGEAALMRASAHLALGRHVSAGRMIRPLLDGSVPAVLPWSPVAGWLVEAEVALLAGERARAVRALRKALAKAGPMGVRYPLVFASAAVVDLLTSQRGRLGDSDAFAAEVLAARRALNIPEIPAPLTKRERNVLRLLPTLRSLDEIAEDLTVSPNTVKTHVRSIYAKLGVRRRREAVTVALEQGLLENLHTEV
ncbi:LuxR C-terminal-related transcriptional regulator [Amycolatopsis taiwanensis]|uniref:LuxR family transcriptional regulator n=1 Tax=Amycolatopsis taiwanensis TaxID=342230 RepID=A0A9W6VIW2_9PSEU|nr:LuxR C-terminal-related transcriptional regulator [Amycolatopsis taiwanensis]GLY68857.1 LuxR family transcriptional regulator [Amycolatopsis taiwanensis]